MEILSRRLYREGSIVNWMRHLENSVVNMYTPTIFRQPPYTYSSTVCNKFRIPLINP